jgi:hypothetical protein
MIARSPHKNGQRQETIAIERTEPSGRILYDVLSILRSESARRHFAALERLAQRGLIRKPASASR